MLRKISVLDKTCRSIQQKQINLVIMMKVAIIAQTYRPMAMIPVYTIREGDFAGTSGGSGFGTWGNAKNPVALLSRKQNNRNNNVNIFGNVYAELDMSNHFTVRSSFGGNLNTSNTYILSIY